MPMALSDRDYFREFLQNISQRQGIEEQEQSFYVPINDDAIRGPDLCTGLLRYAERTLGDAVTLVTGPKGSGKTSELLRFGRQVEVAGQRFFYTDIEDYLRPTELIDAGVLLTSIVADLVDKMQEESSHHSRIPDNRSFVARFKDALRRFQLDGVELSAGVDAGVTQLNATVRGSLRDSAGFRAQVKRVLENNRAQFRDEMFAIVKDVATTLRGTSGLSPVLVVDSLDHWRGSSDDKVPNSYASVRESMDRTFADYGSELRLPGFHVVYCVPSYIHQNWANVHDMLNIKVRTENGEPFQPGLQQLQTVVEQRAPGGDLARLFPKPELLAPVLSASGGVFRDLFRLVEGVIFNTTGRSATDQSVARALAEERRAFTGGPAGLYREQVQLLAEIAHDHHHQFVPRECDLAEFDYLETLGAILRYPDGPDSYWLGIHPLLDTIVGRAPLPTPQAE